MERRHFTPTLVLAVFAAPLAAEAQQAGKVYWVGYLSSAANVFEPFRVALRELGYVEGQNLVMEEDCALRACNQSRKLLFSPPVGP